AGPGDPGMLTLRGLECLQRADVIIHDKLVSPRVLEFAPAAAQRIAVDSLHERHTERWPLVQQMMIDLARQGKTVVRLKGGDPFIFGRGGEEAEALRQEGISYEVVPGITAALAAAACADIPLTHRFCASGVAFVTGHENPTKPESSVDWSALARFPGTLVIYMGMARLELIAKVLLEHGKPADTPAAIIQTASLGSQLARTTTLDKLDAMVRAEGLIPPAIVIIGPVVDFRPVQSWFERRPLFGQRVLVTRPRDQAAEMIHKLELLGANVFQLPVVEVRDPPDWSPVDDAIRRLHEYDWLVFTSVNGVQRFIQRLLDNGFDLRAFGRIKLASIGPGTAGALRHFNLKADVVPASFRSEDLVGVLKDKVKGHRILLARADRGRELLREELAAIAKVDQVAVYSQVDVICDQPELLLMLSRGEIAYVTLTSSNIARAFLNVLDETARLRIHNGSAKLVSISPVTSATIRELSFPIAAEATEHTADGVIQALLKLTAQGRQSLGPSE
ncbi:MAG TPA: uroporphyrinogen-III C-methyltransferase, partial [Gemmataceae bacterium]|nr:uroporphyrinogen-III C-methyltransferase [Gemmataceae bacterium]